MIYTRDNKLRMGRLIKAISTGEMILFTGAGASIDAGYPRWRNLLEEMHTRASERFKSHKARNAEGDAQRSKLSHKQFQRVAKVEDYLWRAEVYRSLLDESAYRTFVAEKFASGRTPGPLLKELLKLNFTHYLTTNYEDCLESACRQRFSQSLRVIDWTDRPRVRDFFSALNTANATNKYVVHLHGRSASPDSIVLTERDYVNRYILTSDSYSRLLALFMTRKLLLVGFSLEDQQFQALFRAVTAHLGSGEEPQHFMLAPSEDENPERKSSALPDDVRALILEEKYSVTPVFYNPANNHQGLMKIVQLLVACAATPSSETPPELLADIQAIQAGAASAPTDHRFISEKTTPTAGPAQTSRAVNKKLPGPTSSSSSKARSKPNVPIDHPLSTPDSDDPRKGNFGGRAEVPPYSLTAEVKEDPEDKESFDITMTVRRNDGKLFRKAVKFYLHPTFNTPVMRINRRTDRIDLIRWAWGAFTVGVVIEEDGTRLELDLADLPGAPPKFASR